MLSILGLAVVFGSVIGGYLMAHGNLAVLIQPAEFIIIFGAGLGAFIFASTGHSLKLVLKDLPSTFFPKRTVSKDTYMQTLGLLHALFTKMHREGVISIEKDIETPESSGLFQRFPAVAKDLNACYFIGDTLRTYLTTGKADELGELMSADIHSLHEEIMVAPSGINRMAESMPGMGIVAAVLGVVLTMGMINEPPDKLGHAIGAALVGTFLGILLCYGIIGPMGAKLETLAHERVAYFHCMREAVVAALRGLSPMVALEYGRRAIPPSYRPTFAEMEQALKGS